MDTRTDRQLRDAVFVFHIDINRENTLEIMSTQGQVRLGWDDQIVWGPNDGIKRLGIKQRVPIDVEPCVEMESHGPSIHPSLHSRPLASILRAKELLRNALRVFGRVFYFSLMPNQTQTRVVISLCSTLHMGERKEWGKKYNLGSIYSISRQNI